MPTYAGIDLHSSNNYIGVINAKDKRPYGRRHDNNLKQVVRALNPFKRTLRGVVVESTYNLYWLVDGLQKAGFEVCLANPAAIQTNSGKKHTDDKWDSFWSAHLLRLGLITSGYIYPKHERPVRDMLRHRMMFVRQRTTQILSFQSMITKYRGITFAGSSIKTFRDDFVEGLFEDGQLTLMAKHYMDTIRHLTRTIDAIEEHVSAKVALSDAFKILVTTPGIGPILGLTTMLEVGDIARFRKVGNYSSYCRCVESKRISNKKRKGRTIEKTATGIWPGPIR